MCIGIWAPLISIPVLLRVSLASLQRTMISHTPHPTFLCTNGVATHGRRSVFRIGGGGSDYGAKIEHTYMTKLLCLFTNI